MNIRFSNTWNMHTNTERILLFDGICNLCNRLVQFIIQRDPEAKFRFAPLQSKKGQEFLLSIKLATDNLDTIVYIKGRNIYYKSSAILHILNDIGGVWKMFYPFIIIPPAIRDSVYTILASIRYKVFGKRNTCMLPSSDIKDRFLD